MCLCSKASSLHIPASQKARVTSYGFYPTAAGNTLLSYNGRPARRGERGGPAGSWPRPHRPLARPHPSLWPHGAGRGRDYGPTGPASPAGPASVAAVAGSGGARPGSAYGNDRGVLGGCRRRSGNFLRGNREGSRPSPSRRKRSRESFSSLPPGGPRLLPPLPGEPCGRRGRQRRVPRLPPRGGLT